MSGGVSDARRGRVHARGDRDRARDHRRNVESPTVARQGKAPRIARGFRRRLDSMTDTPDWNQESIDERVRALAADHYHRPEGTVPRDAMWATIVPAWQAERVIVATPRRGFRASPWRWSAVLAAGLIIGVALDRGIESRLASSRAATPAPTRTAV